MPPRQNPQRGSTALSGARELGSAKLHFPAQAPTTPSPKTQSLDPASAPALPLTEELFVQFMQIFIETVKN